MDCISAVESVGLYKLRQKRLSSLRAKIVCRSWIKFEEKNHAWRNLYDRQLVLLILEKKFTISNKWHPDYDYKRSAIFNI